MVTERRRGPASDDFVNVRLTHKYADIIDGVDLSQASVGDELRLPSREAALLISENWAVPSADDRTGEKRHRSNKPHQDRTVPAALTFTSVEPPAAREPRHPPEFSKPPDLPEPEGAMLTRTIQRPASRVWT
jgi:hypothetical protein